MSSFFENSCRNKNCTLHPSSTTKATKGVLLLNLSLPAFDSSPGSRPQRKTKLLLSQNNGPLMPRPDFATSEQILTDRVLKSTTCELFARKVP